MLLPQVISLSPHLLPYCFFSFVSLTFLPITAAASAICAAEEDTALTAPKQHHGKHHNLENLRHLDRGLPGLVPLLAPAPSRRQRRPCASCGVTKSQTPRSIIGSAGTSPRTPPLQCPGGYTRYTHREYTGTRVALPTLRGGPEARSKRRGSGTMRPAAAAHSCSPATAAQAAVKGGQAAVGAGNGCSHTISPSYWPRLTGKQQTLVWT